MNANEKMRLSKEARMQMSALKKINRWKNTAFVLSAAGVAIAYNGLAGGSQNLFLGISGIDLLIVGAGAAIVCNLGLKNGRENVGKILQVLDEGMKS